ncbi:disease resistance protein RPM1-like [Prosopis cineraria]|uniref:disease resistance protein RPM1-like n=1 Tax=Prosopis cineraria TaxID=364024 RepID=UPI00240FAB79|nr:disease resistance protein RPM1-like [Prosopis cineraria]XP_054793689.1 disease resistance protein RPM1-like [Prosopis cineraria]
MAETAVNFVTETLLRSLEKEVKLQLELKSEVANIRQDLRTIMAFLREADVQAERSNMSYMVKDWVSNVREIAHQIEDVVDDYRYEVARRRTGPRDFLGQARRAGGFARRIVSAHQISGDIEDVRERLSRQVEIRKGLGLTGGEVGASGGRGSNSLSWQELKQLRPVGDENELVGFEAHKENLNNSITLGNQNTVIPIAGEAGLGKTTLVCQLYRHHKKVQEFAAHRAWVDVTQTFDTRNVLKKLIQQLKSQKDFEMGNMETRDLIDEVRNFLQENRCLIVFDDVWVSRFWDEIKHILPSRQNGSRIIITTRINEVASHCKGNTHSTKPFVLKRLERQQAKELFFRFAFQGDECPENLRILSDEIIQKCNGLPLAITTIGSLLSKTNLDNDVSKWQNVHKSLSRVLANDDTDAGKALNMVVSESYYDLPYHLKLCFLYLGVLPEDYPINCNRLIRLWIAEGFVKEKPAEKLEEIGRKYLQELINRNLIQATVVDCDGKVRSCRVHDMMRGFILKKFEELNFCQVLDDTGSDFNSLYSPRRLSIHKNFNENELQGIVSDPGKVRSCILFNTKGISTSFITKFNLMRTLDFDDAPLDALPEEIGDLLLLEYLSLRNTKVKKLPASIGKLQNLLTLDIKNSHVQSLPREINKLTKLRQLLGYSFHGGEIDLGMAAFSYQGLQIMKEGFGKFKDLQELYSIDCYHINNAFIIKELRKLKQLKKLGITRLRRQNGRDLCSTIESLTCLTSLWIGAVEEGDFLELDSLINPPRHLERLYLEGRLRSLPKWIPRLKKLVKLCLYGSGITDDPILALKNLNELLELRLRKAYQGEELHFQKGWLKKLKVLRLRKLEHLKTLKIHDKALPQLVQLYIGPCPQMAEVPDDIQNVKHVRRLETLLKSQRVNRYINNSLHYANIMRNRHGDRDYSEMAQSNLISSRPKAELPHPNGETADWRVWVPLASLMSVFVVMLALASRYLEQLPFWIL